MIRHPDQSGRPSPEERAFLDALCYWRSLYAERGPLDTRPVASIASTIDAAELRMRTLRIRDDRFRRRFVNG